MPLTRKDYLILAEAFDQAYRDADNEGEMLGIDTALAFVADRLKSDNRRFDAAKFRDAATQSRGENL
jgi:hypothetical protein